MKDMNEDQVSTFKFFKIQKSIVNTMEGEPTKFMLAFVDISQKILYDTSKAQTELLSSSSAPKKLLLRSHVCIRKTAF